jgi:hypothetical protein
MSMSDKPENKSVKLIADHISDLLFEHADNNTHRQKFQKAAKALSLTAAHQDILKDNASPAAKIRLNRDSDNLAHFFTHYLSSKLPMIQLYKEHSQKIKVLKEIYIYGNWSVANFALLFNVSPDVPAPPYPAASTDIKDTQTLIAYWEKSLLPAIKSTIISAEKITPERFSWEIKALENDLARKFDQGRFGIEILKPIPHTSWHAAGPTGPF